MSVHKDEKPHLEAQDDNIGVGEVINASGHKQELERQFGLISICSIGITTGNVWAALGGSIVSFALDLPFLILTDTTRSSHSIMVARQVSYTPSLPYHASTL